ncbi:GNAT family N-acetyltransferase [Streptomyces sp. MS1.HAVA.3]|uniref:GNAT family N-acetyltransferase n=1 Tax=Streptomyces caledonius TaxID=3134107 RepID=A0ABU8U418_9ACTN
MTLTVRPAGPGDAADICALLNAVDMIEIGRPETDLGTVESDLNAPDVDLATDSWLAFEGGRLVAYALVWADSGPGRVDGDHYVLPGHREAAALLLDHMEARAREITAGPGVLRLQLNVKPTLDLSLLTGRGYRTIRHYQVMTRSLTRPPTRRRPRPPGSPCATAATTRPTATGRTPWSRRPSPRTSAMWTARTSPGSTTSTAASSTGPWCGSRACPATATWACCSPGTTVRAWAGSATSAYARTCAAAASGASCCATASPPTRRAGRDTLGLGVDIRNETGALALYEAHGMGLHYAVDSWELPLHSQE